MIAEPSFFREETTRGAGSVAIKLERAVAIYLQPYTFLMTSLTPGWIRLEGRLFQERNCRAET